MKQKHTKKLITQPPKLNPEWVRKTCDSFKEFLEETNFPHPEREGTRGSTFAYPEWLIMFIAVLSVKAKAKNYLAIHRLAREHWKVIAKGLPVFDHPISERQLRDRLKKSATRLETLQSSFFKSFLTQSSNDTVSADKMMIRANGPVWHQKQKKLGIIHHYCAASTRRQIGVNPRQKGGCTVMEL